MTKQNQDNTEEDDDIEVGESDDFIPESAQPLCPNCLKPCHPLQYYCDNCGSNEAINPLASYMPYVRIRFNLGMFGKAWRKAWYEKDSSVPFRILCAISAIMYILILAH